NPARRCAHGPSSRFRKLPTPASLPMRLPGIAGTLTTAQKKWPSSSTSNGGKSAATNNLLYRTLAKFQLTSKSSQENPLSPPDKPSSSVILRPRLLRLKDLNRSVGLPSPRCSKLQ